MSYYYSPYTFERICTYNPADWMGRASKPAPDYDPVSESAFWRPEVGEWEIVAAEAPAVPVPQVISRRQAKQALLKAGLLDVVDAAISASGDRAVQIDWADAQEFHRDWVTLIKVQNALGLQDKQVDDFFRLAATL